MTLDRRSGILLHPTSLPGPFGSGDFGITAYHFIDWLVVARQSLWQMLPLNDIGPSDSPYMSPSAFAGNVLLIDLEQLRDAGLLFDEDFPQAPPFDNSHVNFPVVIDFRMARLRRAAKRFFGNVSSQKTAYENFCHKEKDWLDDYALFRTLDSIYGGNNLSWQDWPPRLAQRDPNELEKIIQAHPDDINFWKFCQWCFFEQWEKLKAYANFHDIDIVGDVPIFVALNSADVWAHPELFQLDSSGHPLVVAGVPPDHFSPTGQYWGNPLYRWTAHAAENYAWWVRRMQCMETLYDVVRIDHFRGFESYWEIPANEKTAVNGRWCLGPGADLFLALKEKVSTLCFIAEDLGTITPEVTALRQQFGFPGMRILQFAFDHQPDNLYLPHNYQQDTVVYTGTHDNDTTCGWWSSLKEYDRDYIRRYLSVSGDSIHWDMIRTALASVAAFAITPMQDVLGLDSKHRMNQPGNTENPWEWRFSWDQVDDWHATGLAELTQLYGRIPKPEMKTDLTDA